jgi:hypothetical protein
MAKGSDSEIRDLNYEQLTRITVFWDTESCLNKLGKNHPIALNPLTNLSIPAIAVSGCNAP